MGGAEGLPYLWEGEEGGEHGAEGQEHKLKEEQPCSSTTHKRPLAFWNPHVHLQPASSLPSPFPLPFPPP